MEGLDAVAQHGRALEVEGGGGLLHLPGQLAGEGVVLALQEALDLGHGARVALLRLPSRARGAAPPDVVLDARSLEAAVDLDRAGPQREELAGQAQGLAHGRGRVERPVVRRPVAGHPARHHQAGKGLVGGQLQEGIVLVVAQDDVVAGPVLPDQGGLEHQGLELVVGHDVVEVADGADEGVGLGIVRPGLLEVRAHAALQGGRLAHVDDLGLAVLVEVDAGPIGQPIAASSSRSVSHTACLRRARTRSRSSAACSKSSRRAASRICASSSSMRRAWSSAEAKVSTVSATSTV